MRKARVTAAIAVNDGLRTFEAVSSAALEEGVQFLSTMVQARKAANLPPMFGQGALTSAMAGLTSLAEGLDHIAECHRRLAVHKIEAGLREVAIGDEFPCPTSDATAQPIILPETAHLRSVA